MKKTIIFLILQILLANSFAQINILTFEDDFIILNQDTVNLKDSMGFKQGKWIDFRIDSVFSITSDHDKGFVKEFKYRYFVNEKEGIYKDDRRIGVWKAYYEIDKSYNSLKEELTKGKIRYSLTFTDNEISSFICYYEDGRIKMKGEIKEKNNEFEIMKFDSLGNEVYSKGSEITEINELFK